MYGRRPKSSNVQQRPCVPPPPPPRGPFSYVRVCGSKLAAPLSNVAGCFFPGALACSRQPQASHLHRPYRLHNKSFCSPADRREATGSKKDKNTMSIFFREDGGRSGRLCEKRAGRPLATQPVRSIACITLPVCGHQKAVLPH